MFYFAILIDVSSLYVAVILWFSQAAFSKLLIIPVYGHLPELSWTTWWMKAHSWTTAAAFNFLVWRNDVFCGHHRSFEAGFIRAELKAVTLQLFGPRRNLLCKTWLKHYMVLYLDQKMALWYIALTCQRLKMKKIKALPSHPLLSYHYN